MSKYIVRLALATTLAAVPLASYALGTNEKGCLVGGAAGGLVGHTISGNGTLLGAAVGCGVGIYANKERVKRIDAEAKVKKQREAAARKRQHARTHPRPDSPRYAEQAPR
ncbi:MAG TPA: hypothetical protein VFP36_01185 [Usitatibacter sp.]|nr:hypothetical protein [Usitatibacter sp.]